MGPPSSQWNTTGDSEGIRICSVKESLSLISLTSLILAHYTCPSHSHMLLEFCFLLVIGLLNSRVAEPGIPSPIGVI